MRNIHETPLGVNNSCHRSRYEARTAVIFDTRLSPGACRLYMAIDDYAGSKGRAWPQQDTLAARLNTSIRTIQRWLEELVDCSYLECVRTMAGNRYLLAWLHVKNGASHAPSASHPSLFENPDQEPDQSGPTEPTTHFAPSIVVEKEEVPRKEPMKTREIDSEAKRCIVPVLEEFAKVCKIRNRDGSEWDPRRDAAAVHALLRAARTHGITLYQLAAYLQNRLTYAQLNPRNAPQSPFWFGATVDNHFRRRESPNQTARPVQRECTALPDIADVSFAQRLLRTAVAGVGGMK